jgi:hypothetical protein
MGELWMVSDEQIRRVREHMEKDGVLWKAASKGEMCEKTARKYLRAGELPSQMKKPHTWRTREDPFEGVWEEIREMLEESEAKFEAKTLFEYLQRKYPGRFQDGQLRTLQRRMKVWRALEGPSKEVYFSQVHHPGELAQSDFTRMGGLGITIGGQPFDHMIFHFVLTYSNWESGTVCYGESYESLSQGLQNALWELGGVPKAHQTDRLTAAVHQLQKDEKESEEGFTQRYRDLMSHYGLEPRKIQVGQPNENGDVEQSHHRLKRGVEQALLLRGSCDFKDLEEYQAFLKDLMERRNENRRDRFGWEQKVLRALPSRRIEDTIKKDVRVGRGSTIRVQNNTYSVHSRLIGEGVEARVKMDEIEVWYAQRCVERMPRLRGSGKHRIDYRHVIDSLVRKPGAFANHIYQSDFFPTSRFRMAYDALSERIPSRADSEYLKILEKAAKDGESEVDEALRLLIAKEETICFEAVRQIVDEGKQVPAVTEVEIDPVELAEYDDLFFQCFDEEIEEVLV